MNKLSIIALALVSAAASAQTVTINSLPASIGVACSAKSATLGNRKVTIVEENENGENYNFRSIKLQGAAADRVKSASVATTKAGFFPKCAIVLR